MNKTTLAIVVIVVVVLGGYFFFRGSYQSPATPSTSNQEAASQSGAVQVPVTQTAPPVEQSIITYSNSGYSPSALRIKAGTAVTFKNESSLSMWTASAFHPSHTVYSGTALEEHCPDTAGIAFDACTGVQPGNSWKFIFNKKGTWKYHNHLNPSDFGAIVVY